MRKIYHICPGPYLVQQVHHPSTEQSSWQVKVVIVKVVFSCRNIKNIKYILSHNDYDSFLYC